MKLPSLAAAAVLSSFIAGGTLSTTTVVSSSNFGGGSFNALLNKMLLDFSETLCCTLLFFK